MVRTLRGRARGSIHILVVISTKNCPCLSIFNHKISPEPGDNGIQEHYVWTTKWIDSARIDVYINLHFI